MEKVTTVEEQSFFNWWKRREVLIKAVAQANPTDAMSVFRLPSTLCEDIRSLIARF